MKRKLNHMKAPNGVPLFAAPLMSLDECARKMGITRQRCQQIEHSAFKKIREAFARQGIFKMDDLLAVC